MYGVVTDRLRGKRFLLVLDDVWDQSQAPLTSLQVPLKCAAPGSKIIVTTRSTKVAKMMVLKIHQLGTYLIQIAGFCAKMLPCEAVIPVSSMTILFSVGKSIAAMCKGLWLAANAVAMYCPV
jgi:hypothetical protein